MKKQICRKDKRKGFTLIELIVVIAVIGILVLLAAPRFIGKTEDAKMTQIINDVRIAEVKLDELLISYPESFANWDEADNDKLATLKDESKLVGSKGSLVEVSGIEYREIPKEFMDQEIRSNLDGTFYATEMGNVLYAKSKSEQVKEEEEEEESNGLVAGTISAGYYGVVAGSKVISGDELAQKFNFTRGTAQNRDAGWLKFSKDGNPFYVAKKQIMGGVSFNDIKNAGGVDGDKTIELENGEIYKVRLITEDEWTAYVLPLHENAITIGAESEWVHNGGTGIDMRFTDADLFVNSTVGTGGWFWTQSSHKVDTDYYVTIGADGTGHFGRATANFVSVNSGWRPVLEYIGTK